jgi:ABC-2 type transport system ATP-binding protein
VSGVSHLFGRFAALRDVSFEVGRGEVFGFIGPNGAGKTTTIRMIASLLEPQYGRVEVLGFDTVEDAAEVRKRIGYMPDHAGVYDQISVREYLDFFAAAYHVADAGAVVNAVMDLTDLRKLDEKLVSSMSKGMKQRLQLARTLLHDPEVLILDEPASDLDPRARIEMRDLITELRRMGKTVFLSSHILTELADVCTSVAILERGQLVVSGPIDEIADRLAARRMPPNAETSGPTGADGAPATRVQRTSRIRVLGDAALARDVLLALGHVDVHTLGSATLSVVHRDESALAEVVKQLVLKDIPVVGVESQRNELERVFLEATQGDLQ